MARLEAELHSLDLGSLVAAIDRASVDAELELRLASLAVLTAEAHRTALGSDTIGDLAEVRALLDLVADENPGIEHREDFEPLPIGVRCRWRGELFIVPPGAWERPVALLEQAHLISSALDPLLDGELGFGLGDLVELALRYADSMCELWLERDGGLGDVDLSNVLERTVEGCSSPNAARRALDWASVDAGRVEADASTSSGVFGSALAVRQEDTLWPLPTAFVLDSIYAASEQLLDVGLGLGEGVERWREVAEQRTLRVLLGRNPIVATGIDAGEGAVPVLQFVKDGLHLAADFVGPGLGDFESAVRRLNSLRPGREYSSPAGEGCVPTDSEIVRVAILVGTLDFAVGLPSDGEPVSLVSLETLRWMVTTSERPEDIALFLQSCQAPGREHRMSFGMFDMWEVWRSEGGAFHLAGSPISALFFDPHHERLEWELHEQRAWLEAALLRLGLAGLTRWPEVIAEDGPLRAAVTDATTKTSVQVGVGAGGVAIAVRSGFGVRGEVRATEIARAVFWKLVHLDEGAVRKIADGELRIDVHDFDADFDEVRARRERGQVSLAFGIGLGARLLADSLAVEEELGSVIAAAAGVEGNNLDEFMSSWNQAPSGIAVDAVGVAQRAHHLPQYDEVHPYYVQSARVLVAQMLHDRGVKPGVRSRADARDLESKVIYPFLSSLLDAELGRFDAELVRLEVLERLESVHLTRMRQAGHHARMSELSTQSESLASVSDDRTKTAVASRVLGMLVELTLQLPEHGDSAPTASDLDRLEALASLLHESGFRSEAIHVGLIDACTEITEDYRILLRAGPDAFDQAAYAEAHASATLPARPPAKPMEEPDPSEVSIVGLFPKLSGVDDSLRGSLGFGLDALVGTLDHLSHWEVADSAPVARVPLVELVETISADATSWSSEVGPAVQRLLLGREVLELETLEPWELDRRAVRLLTRPVVETRSGEALVAPWAAGTTRSVILNHLEDGRLPWPESALPSDVTAALKSYRSQRNRELEQEAVERLADVEDIRVRGSLKPKRAAQIGVPDLPGEIDFVAVHLASRRVWVGEVKDRAMAFSPRQIQRAIDDFVIPGTGFCAKLLAKTEVVRAHAEHLLASMGVEYGDRKWEVLPIFVTRRVEPAAFAQGMTIEFRTVTDLGSLAA